jgi:hypothetical protein
MKRTADFIEQAKELNPADSLRTKATSEKSVKRGAHPNSLKNLKMYVKGQSGNPGGRPKDVAGAFARLVIEETLEESYAGFAEQLAKGNAYAFSVLSDRGYGKLKQGIVHTGDEDGGPVKTHLTVEFVEPDGKQ